MLHNNAPPDSELASGHAAVEPNRSTHARPAIAIASNASAPVEPAGVIRPSCGSRACAHRVKCERTASAPTRNARRHPRTVSGGNPSAPATRRCPRPRATISSNAGPITATSSRRRSNARSPSRTCVPAHARHFARRGRKTTSPPARQRNTRDRAQPHGPKRNPVTARTRQQPRHKIPLDHDQISVYDQHRCPQGIQEPSRRDTPNARREGSTRQEPAQPDANRRRPSAAAHPRPQRRRDAQPEWRPTGGSHNRGRVVRDLAAMLAEGGDCLSRRVLDERPGAFARRGANVLDVSQLGAARQLPRSRSRRACGAVLPFLSPPASAAARRTTGGPTSRAHPIVLPLRARGAGAEALQFIGGRRGSGQERLQLSFARAQAAGGRCQLSSRFLRDAERALTGEQVRAGPLPKDARAHPARNQRASSNEVSEPAHPVISIPTHVEGKSTRLIHRAHWAPQALKERQHHERRRVT